MPLSSSDELRLLNLAYRQMQLDFRRFAPDLFRGTTLSLTTDASGYIYLPVTTYEVETIAQQSDPKYTPEKIQKKEKYVGSGWYHDGVQTSGDNAGKRRIAFRKEGAAWTSYAVYVDVLVEYPDLIATSAAAYPFVQSGYLDMLTELQAFFYFLEQGKEHAKDMEKHWQIYQHFLKQARLDLQDDAPTIGDIGHPDAGSYFQGPYLRE